MRMRGSGKAVDPQGFARLRVQTIEGRSCGPLRKGLPLWHISYSLTGLAGSTMSG
jgi:hypothetical protein